MEWLCTIVEVYRDDNDTNDGIYIVMILIPMMGTMVMIIIPMAMEMIIIPKMGDDNDNNDLQW